jgi:hypothetical protein
VVQNVETPVGSSGFPAPTTTNPCAVPAPATPPTTTPVDPCAQRKYLATLALNQIIANQNAQILASGLHTGNEYGANENITNFQDSNPTYMNTPLSTSDSNEGWVPTFTWNPTSGYTIGISHYHPDGTAPSPDDIFVLMGNLLNNKDLSASPAGQTYYKSHVSVTAITNGTTYVVTINNWATLQTLYNQYIVNTDQYDTKYLSNVKINNGSYEYTLLSTFGDAINLYTAPNNSAIYTPVATNSSKSVSNVVCP